MDTIITEQNHEELILSVFPLAQAKPYSLGLWIGQIQFWFNRGRVEVSRAERCGWSGSCYKEYVKDCRTLRDLQELELKP